jgi:hypothetical protein
VPTENEGGSKIAKVIRYIGLGTWRWTIFSYFYFYFIFFCCPVLNIFPFPVSTEKLLDNFLNNWQSVANWYLRFAYSSCLFCCNNTIGAVVHTLLIGKAQRIQKIHEITLLVLYLTPLLL